MIKLMRLSLKLILVLILISLNSSSVMADDSECDSGLFIIYYVPLDTDFYIPPSREDIMQIGDKFELESCLLSRLFKNISEQKGIEPESGDYKSLRIMIVNKKDSIEVFITQERKILSGTKKFTIDDKLINDVLNELNSFIDTEKHAQ